MDYDDNDLNSQNFHLAGDSSTKFPPGLQPCALPKFDFDDSHLRFDSLVETEVFLGIESNQDNHWIEDFSRGGSGIEFNSSAAEPCSISRRNNVWSEATSSESVEMLLKSVGQEEIITVSTIVEESNACNELGLLTKQMDPSLKHDENIPSETEDVKTSEKTLPPNEVAGDIGEDPPCVEDASKAQGGVDFSSGVMNSVDQSTDSVKGVLPLDEEGVFADIGSYDVSQKEVGDVEKKDIQPRANDASSEKPENIKGDEMTDQNVDASSFDAAHPGEKPTHSVAEVVEADKSNVEEPSIRSMEGHSDIHTVGGSSTGESFGATNASECENVMICEDKRFDDQSKDNILVAPPETLTSDAQLESGKDNGLENSQLLDSDILVHNPDGHETPVDSLSNEIHVPATIVAEPNLIHEKDKGFAETDVYECSEDVSISGKENAEVLNDCSNMDVDSPGKEVGSSSLCQDVALINSNLVSDGVPLPYDDGATLSSGQTSLPVVASNQLEIEEETVTKTLAEPLSASVSEAEEGANSCDASGPLLYKNTKQSLPPGNSNQTETLFEAPVPTVDVVGEDTAKALEPSTNVAQIILQSESIPLAQSHDNSLKVHEDNGSSSPMQNVPVPETPALSHAIDVVEEGIKDSVKQDVSVSKVIDGKAKKNASNTRAPKINDISVDGKTGSSAKLASKIAEGSPSCSLPSQVDPKIVQDIPQTSAQVSDADIAHGRLKNTPERKSRRSSVKASAKKGTQSKERQSEKSGNVPISPAPAIFHVMQSNELQPYGHIDVNNNKPYFVLAASSSSLPDLNSSATSSNVFQQPFTDFQQVQLRAQIFVYGALIQGTAPEEAYMMSAFGGLDGGRCMWGNAWQAIIERLQNQKSTPTNPETPLYSRHGTPSVSRTVDQVGKQSTAQNKVTSTPPVGRSTTKSSPAVSPLIPLSSPLWSMPTPGPDTMQSNVMPRGSVMDYQQALGPFQTPFQTPSHRNLLGNSPSWMPQPSYRGPWVPSQQPLLPESSARLSSFPPAEPVQLTPAIKETSVSQSSTKHVSPGPTVQTGAPTTVFTAGSPLVDLKKATPSQGQQSTEPKPRKRKKNSAPAAETAQIMTSQPHAVLPVLPPVLPIDPVTMSTSSAIQTPALLLPQATPEKLVLPPAQPPLLDSFLQPDHGLVVPRTILSEESLGNIKEASKQAEDATALAAAAVGHSQDIWSQLEKQKNSGLLSDLDAKLSSAAVAVAAAAAVARAAAAAANVASNAALQAKLMAEEAFVLNRFGNSSQGTIMLSPGNSSSSILTAAREAARRRVEAASAAAKRAENMDAIVKAAELASEAVSHAGKVVAMGDPMTLSELIEAGPEGYWRAPQKSPELIAKSTELGRDLYKSGGGDMMNSIKPSKGGRSGKKGTQMTANMQSSISMDLTAELIDGTSGSVAAGDKELRRQRGHQFSDLTKNIVVVLESDPISTSSSFNVENEVHDPKGNSIKEGSKVEVFKVGDGFKAAWYTADVLSLNDGKACVSYTEIEQNEDSILSEEWVPLAGEGDNPPKIRITRPVTTLQYEGTRKRRREAMGDYNWNVGDRVDAWMNNSWWEGVVTEKNKKDETSLTVHFPARSETSTVKAWHLRSSLHWKDGQWVEWSKLQHNSTLPEGDTPQEKRLKLGSPAVGKDKPLKASDVSDSGKLELSGNERTFNIGKSSKSGLKPDPTRMARTGLQTEGSRVVFGIPKPGKKRKFMEVSKHYVADQNNRNDEPSDSIKHLKYSAPQGTRGLRNDPKEKRVAESKLKGLKPGKQQTAFGRTVPQKNFSAVAGSNSGDGSTDTAKAKDSSSHGDVTSRAEGAFVFSAASTSDGPSTKKFPSSSAKHDRGNKGKLGPVGKKLGKIEEEKVDQNPVKSTSEAAEPRRSNRRIQPTSRLLEGLQSSLIMPKFPTLSHDKGQRSQSKNTPRGNNRG